MQAVRFALLSIFCLLFGPSCALLGTGETALVSAKGYKVRAPQGWKTIDHQEADQAYRLPSGSIVTVTSSCDRNPDAPLDSLTRHLLMGMRTVRFQDRQALVSAGTTGQYSQVTATLDGKPVSLNLFVVSKSRCVFDFVLMNTKPLTESDSSQFRELIGSFSFDRK